MNILIVNRAMGILFGGGESFDYNSAKYLQKLGHDVTVLTGKPLLNEHRTNLKDINVIYLPIPDLRNLSYKTEKINSKISASFYHLDNYIFEKSVISWLLKEKRYKSFDVIQCCSLFRIPKVTSIKLGVKTVSWLPGKPSKLAKKQIAGLCRSEYFKLFSHGKTLDFLSAEMSYISIGNIPPGIESYNYPEFKKDELKSKYNIDIKSKVGITVCRHIPIKSIDLLIKSLTNVINSHPTYRHIFIGDGPLLEKHKTIVRQLGIDNSIIFMGGLNIKDVHELYEMSDIFVLNSKYESFSMVTIEAMSHGLPIIVTDRGHLPTLVEESKSGFYVEYGNINLLTNKIIETIELKEEELEKLRENGKRYSQSFIWENISKKLEQYYKDDIN